MYEFVDQNERSVIDIHGNRVPFARNAYDLANGKFLY
jgi:hypothetical protein